MIFNYEAHPQLGAAVSQPQLGVAAAQPQPLPQLFARRRRPLNRLPPPLPTEAAQGSQEAAPQSPAPQAFAAGAQVVTGTSSVTQRATHLV